MGARPALLHGATEPVPAGALRLAPDFVLRIGEATSSITGGLAACLLGDDDAPGLVLTIAGRHTRRLLLSRFEPAVVWRHDGSDTADAEIALGLVSLRTHGGFGGRVIAAIRDPQAVATILADAGAFEAASAEPDVPAIPAEAGPVLILANGVFCGGALAPLLAAASARGPLAPPWRRIGADPFGPTGPEPVEAVPGSRDAIAVDPAIVALPGRGRDRRLLAATFANVAAGGAAGGWTDGELAERFRVLAIATGTPVDATVLDRFVVSWRSDRDDRPLAPIVNARALGRTRRLAAMRDTLAGSRARPPDPA